MRKLFFMATGFCLLVSGACITVADARVAVGPRGNVAVTRPVARPVARAATACAVRNTRVLVNGVWVTRAHRVC